MSRNSVPVGYIRFVAVLGAWLFSPTSDIRAAETFPKEGDTAQEFSLKDSAGTKIALSELRRRGPVVLVVLRGFPGYQCPACNRQVGQYIAQSKRFAEAGATVVFVYPGPSRVLPDKANEFGAAHKFPTGIHLLLDPDYTFTNEWKLRWEAPGETAYPSTFVIDQEGQIVFAKVSRTHGGRSEPDAVLKAIPQKSSR